jgi:hypothetical protein
MSAHDDYMQLALDVCAETTLAGQWRKTVTALMSAVANPCTIGYDEQDAAKEALAMMEGNG